MKSRVDVFAPQKLEVHQCTRMYIDDQASVPPWTAVQKLTSVSISDLRVCKLTVQYAQLAYKHRGAYNRRRPCRQGRRADKATTSFHEVISCSAERGHLLRHK